MLVEKELYNFYELPRIMKYDDIKIEAIGKIMWIAILGALMALTILTSLMDIQLV